jgi:MFS transporter, PPP family, 3-phenylpropionic acid transporter
MLPQAPLPRFILLYAALFTAFGFSSPFLPAFLASRGLQPEALGLVLGAGTALRLISGLIAGRLADARNAFRAELAIFAVLAAIAALIYLPTHVPWQLAAISLVQAAALAPLVPLADALALTAASRRNDGRGGFEYGFVRGAGSAAFMAGMLLAGQAVAGYGLVVTIWIGAACLVAASFCAPLFRRCALPRPRLRNGRKSSGATRSRCCASAASCWSCWLPRSFSAAMPCTIRLP